MQCDPSFVLDPAKSPPCVQACDNGVPVLLDNLRGKQNLCYQISPAVAGCKRIARFKITNKDQDSSSDGDYLCVAVDSLDYYASYDLAAMPNVVGMPYQLGADKPAPENYNYFGFGVMPVLKTSDNIKPEAKANCDLFFVVAGMTSPATQCLRCAFRTHKVVVNNAKQTKCEVLADCNSNILLSGLPSYLNALLGCHSCTALNDVQRFPTLKLVYDDATKKWIHYQPAAQADTWVDGLACLAAPGQGAVTDCIAYASVLKGSDTPASVCLACARWQRPIYDNTLTWKVNSCELIENCD